MGNCLVLLDAAHGIGDDKILLLNGNKIKEKDFNHKLLTMLMLKLKIEKINYAIVGDGGVNIDIKDRIDIVNKIVSRYSDKHCFLISLHGKIFETFKWGCVSKGDEVSGQIADIYCGFAEDMLGLPIKRMDINYVQSIKKYGLIKEALCPAILTENKVNKTLQEEYTTEDIERLIDFHVVALKTIAETIFK